MPNGEPEVPAEVGQYLARLSVSAGQLGRAVDAASASPQAAAQDLDRAAARTAARLKTKVEERTGDAPGTPQQVTARLMAAFPKARVVAADDSLRLTVPVRVTRAQRIVLDLEFGAPAQSRVPVRLRGFGMEGRLRRKPTRTVTDRAWAAIMSDGS
jgi:pyruvate/2-oxoglutarate dehydrogenase complex dihydrolipoamide acyltransferase (E2) component